MTLPAPSAAAPSAAARPRRSGPRLPRLPLTRLPLAASGWITLLCVSAVADAAPLRMAVVGCYLLFCPGLAMLRPFRDALRTAPPSDSPVGLRLDTGEGGAEAGQTVLLVVMLSLSALVLAATALMLAGAFSGTGTLVILAALTTVTSLLPRLRAQRG